MNVTMSSSSVSATLSRRGKREKDDKLPASLLNTATSTVAKALALGTTATVAPPVSSSSSSSFSSTMIQPDLWQHALSFLSEIDLCSAALVSREFYRWATEDRLWEPRCHRQWEGKQGRKELFFQSKPGGLSWKQRYAWAAYDGQRQIISREEICYYSWRLIYNGCESKLGLRKFMEDGTYHSPYAGLCEWTLSDHNRRLVFMGMSLPIERDLETWGWVIGKGSATAYFSVSGSE